MAEVNIIPELRFPEFESDWSIKSLSNFITSLDSGVSVNSDNTPATENQFGILKTSCVSRGVFKPEENKSILENEVSRARLNPKKDSILISRMNTPDLVGEIGYVPFDYPNLFLPDRLWMTETNTRIIVKWLAYLLITPKHRSVISSIGTGTSGSMKNISKPNFLGLKFYCPQLEEQQKIASFLTAVDERIQLLQKKKAKLEEYKKGVMQKLFPAKAGQAPEIRFKDENGNEFQDWEQKKLGEIGATFNGLTGKTKDDFGEGKPYVQYMQIFSNSKINIEDFGLVKIDEGENQSKLQYGDVFFTTSSETPNEIGTASVMLDEVGDVFLNSFCFGFRPNSLSELVPDFSRYLFRSALFRREIIKLAQGSTRFNMSKVSLMKLIILLPNEDEQKKIARFLTSLDESIESHGKEIESTTTFKKGLLQKMFV